jgi:hypothetical protein
VKKVTFTDFLNLLVVLHGGKQFFGSEFEASEKQVNGGE